MTRRFEDKPAKRERVPMRDRFMAKVRQEGECLVWTGCRHGQGYGMFSTGRTGDRKMSYAHRVAYELENGPVPDGMFVCHHCDNPPCVDPSHLFLGTHLDNVRDRDAKGRQVSPRGESHHSAKLTESKVREIRRRYVPGNGANLGIEFGVTEVTINKIVLRRTWKAVQ